MADKSVVVQFRCDEDTIEKLDIMAKKHRSTRSDTIRFIVSDNLWVYDKKEKLGITGLREFDRAKKGETKKERRLIYRCSEEDRDDLQTMADLYNTSISRYLRGAIRTCYEEEKRYKMI